MQFPQTRMRRLRKTSTVRDLVRETGLASNDFVLPLFVRGGERVQKPVSSMPGVFQLSIDELCRQCERCLSAGVTAVLLFGIPDTKDDEGKIGYDDNGIVQRAVREVKKRFPSLFVVTDVCNCEYTTHGHCGPVKNGDVDNDATLEILARQALSHAAAGADMVAPSDMMDGRVARIRRELDCHGFSSVPILSYAAKFASSFYGPFREAAGSTPSFGDRKTYQMDFSNARQALMEMELDINEGADLVMVKPALCYLDIISRARLRFDVPIAAFNVSGEYAMVKAAAAQGWLDEQKTVMELLTAIKRAGADLIITYHAVDAAQWLAAGWKP
jgi:porphobilinogen synthase